MKATISNCCVVFFQKHIPHFNYQIHLRLELSPPTAINNAVMNTTLISSQNPVETRPQAVFFKAYFLDQLKVPVLGPAQTYDIRESRGGAGCSVVDAPGDGDVHA